MASDFCSWKTRRRSLRNATTQSHCGPRNGIFLGTTKWECWILQVKFLGGSCSHPRQATRIKWSNSRVCFPRFLQWARKANRLQILLALWRSGQGWFQLSNYAPNGSAIDLESYIPEKPLDGWEFKMILIVASTQCGCQQESKHLEVITFQALFPKYSKCVAEIWPGNICHNLVSPSVLDACMPRQLQRIATAAPMSL